MKKIISKSILLTIIVIMINFGFKIYLSYHIEKDKIGIFYTIFDMVSVITLFFTGYKDSMIKIFAEQKFVSVKYYIFRNYLVATIFFIPVLYLLYQNLKFHLYDFIFFIVFFIVTQISNYYSYLNVAHRNYDSMLYEKSVKAIALILCFFIYSHYFDAILALVLAYITQLICHTAYLYLTSPQIFFIKGKKNINNYMIFFKNYILATITSFFGSINIYLSAVIMMYLYKDSNILSEYQIVAKSIFFALVVIFVHPVAAYTFPEISRLIEEKKINEINRISRLLLKYLFVFFLILILATLITKWTIGIVFPNEYINSYKLLNKLLPILPFIVYTSFSINILKGFNRFDLALYVRAFGSFLFFSSVYLLYTFGVDSKNIIYSLDISFLGMFGLAYYYKTRLLK